MSLTASSHLLCPETADWDDGDIYVDSSPPPSQRGLDFHHCHHHGGGGEEERGFVGELLALEQDLAPGPDYSRRFRDRSLDPTARQDCISWMLKVHAHYRFLPATACLAVNYLDRFLAAHTLPRGTGWPFQLLAVACLSLAAKMEETEVPLLLDLQLMAPAYVFEPLTVRRMELLVMAALRWRLRSVSPYDFLHYYVSRSGLPLPSLVFSRASDLILSTLRVIDFLDFRPSEIAAAAVLSGSGAGFLTGNVPKFCEGLSEESVVGCHRLMEEYLVDTCPSAARLKGGSGSEAEAPERPMSPVGVLDAAACGSCDTVSQITASEPAELGAEDEPPSKRPKLGANV